MNSYDKNGEVVEIFLSEQIKEMIAKGYKRKRKLASLWVLLKKRKMKSQEETEE